MATIRVARSVGQYQISLEGDADKIDSIIKEIDSLAERIGKSGDNTKVDTVDKIPVENNRAVPPTVAGTSSAQEAVIKLFESDWGASRHSIREIKEALDANALFYPITSLSGVLASLARQGKLRRWKESQGYVYVRGRIT